MLKGYVTTVKKILAKLNTTEMQLNNDDHEEVEISTCRAMIARKNVKNE